MDNATRPPIAAVRAAVALALTEDLTPLGDITSALLDPAAVATADFVARCPGVLAGVDCATEAFGQIDPSVRVEWRAGDGERIEAGQFLGRVSGPLAPILTAERAALNFLCHLSGIATLTARYVAAVAEAGGAARIWDTRKTTPGLRSLEKAAVRAGGGLNHRGNLSEWVLLKDNHLASLGIEEGVKRARAAWPARTVHVECDTISQVDSALCAGADAVLLDNMSPDEVRECVALAERWASRSARRRPLIEVSGGVSLDTVAAFAASGADLISVGAITMSAPALDIGLDLEVRG